MDTEERLKLVREVGAEIVTEEELKNLLETKTHPVAYDGFEPSGKIHIAQGLMRAININKMIRAGVRFKILVADWHAWANRKMGGDLEKIQKVGKYFIEVWKGCGLSTENVEFIWASELTDSSEYWKTVMQVATNCTVNRIVRCSQIMGRGEHETLSAAQLLYPSMQCADIFHLNVDICQLGLDQRKVNMLARELGPKLGFWKPVVVSHHMLMGLTKPKSTATDKIERVIELKMSKSVPESAIFMNDSPEMVRQKLMKAYCPEKQVHENPILEYAKYIVFEKFDEFEIKRPEKFGGNAVFRSYPELEKAFVSGDVHPQDMKQSVADYINQLLEPVRRHFEKNRKARELADFVAEQDVTR